MSQFTKTVLLRFIRAFVAGAVSALAVLGPLTVRSWHDLSVSSGIFALAALVGGINGVIQAADKAYRYVPSV